MTAPSPPAALNAFLRGIEPRARVLARAQAGPGLDDGALLEAVRAEFLGRAARLPLAEWPLRYWGLLLARDELTRPAHGAPAHPLYALAHTRRLAVLLRLVVGLEPVGAARVLGLSEDAYRALCADAEEKLDALGVGPAVLLRWQEAFQQEVRVAGAPSAPPRFATARPVDAPAKGRARGRPTALQWALIALAAALLAALAATFVWPPPSDRASAAPGAPTVSALPADPAADDAAPGATVAAPRNLDADLLVDPDFALLADAADAPWRQGVAFLSWHAVTQRLPLPPPPAAEPAPPTPEWAALPPELRTLMAPAEAAWPALDAAARRGLQAQAIAWQQADPARRQALRAAYADWLALPALARSAQRAAHADWRALDPGEQAAVAGAAADLAAAAPERRQAALDAFAALDPAVQRDWAQGPRLGRQLPGLRPLLQHLPAAERVALIEALDALEAPTRDALAGHLAGLGTAERAALRGRVLALPAGQRPAAFAEAVRPR